MTGTPAVSFHDATKVYAGRTAVDRVTFDVPAGCCLVILGPSGCGKTTLLKTVNRLVELTAGSVAVRGTNVRLLDPATLRRSTGYVIQHIGLFPHMTVAENVAVVPSLLGWPRERTGERVSQMLELVHLPAAQFGGRLPAALSGGQQQRVGLARALAADPPLLLMDEPFGALDAIERARLQGELAALQHSLRKTILFVTHDVDEALRLADFIVVMRDGRVEQYGRPISILAKPASAFVAELVNAADVVRRFGVLLVRDAVAPRAADGAAAGDSVRLDDDLRTALSKMLAGGHFELGVVDGEGQPAGTLTLEGMLGAARRAAQ